MPTIQVSYQDMCGLIGLRRSPAQLADDLLFSKAELEGREGDRLTLAIEDTNRPELWSAEGVAREIRQHLRAEGLKTYAVRPSGVRVIVDKALADIRPLTVCAVVRNLRITPESLAQMIQLQEKVCETFGRRRHEVALGVYDLHKITPPIRYFAADPQLRFTPLGFSRPLSLRRILAEHPKGKEYGHLLAAARQYPLFQDAAGEVLSLPPIINSAHTGEVTTKTRDVFIECSGFSYQFLEPALSAVVCALAERGGRLESVEISTPAGRRTTPDLAPKTIRVPRRLITETFGFDAGSKALRRLARQSGMASSATTTGLRVTYPAYRQDIMHPVDVVEDLLIAYGYNKLAPEESRVPSTGALLPLSRLADDVAALLAQYGAQEVMTYTLTNPDVLFAKMNQDPAPVIELENPSSRTWSVFRPSLVPLLLEVLGRNTTTAYPQHLFEVGQAVRPEPLAPTRAVNPVCAAWALAAERATFTDARQAVEALCRGLAVMPAFSPASHPALIPGRAAAVSVNGTPLGLVGEVHPQVLANWKIEFPVCAFELDLSALHSLLP